jgi:hypothetical protein
MVSAATIISNSTENRTCLVNEIAQERNDDLDFPKIHIHAGSDDGAVASEIQEIYKSIADSINSLFRLSIIIRNNTSRDRYTKATAAGSSPPFDASYDVNHVRQKFPCLGKGKEWLVTRLGKAITTRRQYLRYCREHHQKIAKEPEDIPAQGKSDKDTIAPATTGAHTAGGFSGLSKPTSTLAPTQASTLLMLNPGQTLDEEPPNEVQSHTSYATSYEEDSSNNNLHVAALEDISKGLKHFECPYCFQIQSITTQKAWK